MTRFKFSNTIYVLIFAFFFLTFSGSLSVARAADASLKFSPDTLTVPANSQFSVSVLVDTAGFPSGGVGTIINFDPGAVSVISVKTGQIFADYPISATDNNHGKITISGIAASPDDLFEGQGTFAEITFQAKNPLTTTISFNYTPGSTVDSNIAVTFGNGDILNRVDSLRVNIVMDNNNYPAPVTSVPAQGLSFSSIKSNWNDLISSLKLPFFRDKYATSREGRPVSHKLEPLEPIIAQPPITDPYSYQPIASIYNITAATTEIVKLVLTAVIALTVLAIILIFYKRSASD